MASSSTEIHLTTWRGGPTQAERLTAALLRMEGYSRVEPQSPLGGPDGRADVLCDRGGYTYVAAAYFPPTTQTPADIEAKFCHDLEGVLTRSRRAFAFFTNQRLTRGERENLKGIALKSGVESEIYDVERICGMLDEPAGYGVRAAFLSIPMSEAEQIAYFARRESATEAALEKNTRELRRLTELTGRLEAQSRVVAHTLQRVAVVAGDTDASPPLRLVDPLSVGELTDEKGVGKISYSLGPELLLMTHRMVCFELPSRMIGRFRTEEVWIGLVGEKRQTVTQPSEIPTRVTELCAIWREAIRVASSRQSALDAITKFHHGILMIHPFLDGNGRTARALLLQQCVDAFGRADMSRLDRGVAYQDALESADAGKYQALSSLIASVVAD